MNKKKFIITFLLLVSMLVSLTACNNDSATENEGAGENKEAVDNKITVALSAQILNLDPHVSMAPSDIVKKHVFEGLTYIDLEGKVHPWLAESWEVAPDNKTWTFHLKKGVKFHDGTDFDANAVKISFERLLNPDNGLNRRFQLTFIDQINVIDPYTVEIVTKDPYCAMENILDWSGSHIISPASIEKYGKDVARYPVGTGPYVVAENVSGEYVTLEKFGEYWGEKPSLDEVKFITVPEEGTRIAMLETGEVDYIVSLSPQEISRIEENDKLTVGKDPSNRVLQLGINTTKAPLDNKKVRQALNYAVDRELILENVMGGIGIPATSVIASNVWGYAEGIFPYEYNPEKAKELLAEAGYPNGFDLTMWTPQGRYFRDKELNLAVAGMFQEIGVNAQVEVVDLGSYYKQLRLKPEENKSQMYILAWESATGEASHPLRSNFLTENMAPTGWNAMFYSNPELDKVIYQAVQTLDEAQRLELWKEAQEIILDDAVWIPMFVLEQVSAHRSDLKGVEVFPLEIPYFGHAYLEK